MSFNVCFQYGMCLLFFLSKIWILHFDKTYLEFETIVLLLLLSFWDNLGQEKKLDYKKRKSSH